MKTGAWEARALARRGKEKPRGHEAGGAKIFGKALRGRRALDTRCGNQESIIVKRDQAPEEGDFFSGRVAGARELRRVGIKCGWSGGLERVGGDRHRAAEDIGFATA